jgi:S-adenosylmethionine:tRNA ribosyltransferase-isomerase
MLETIPPEYYYDLPAERIARYPLHHRDSSKLLVYRHGEICYDNFINLDNYVPAGSLLVFNNTRVIRARLLFRRESGAKIEVFCLEPASPPEYTTAFTSHGPVEWNCLVGNLKRWKKGLLKAEVLRNGQLILLQAEKLAGDGDTFRIRFTWTPVEMSFGEIIDAAGHVPLPPYINRNDEEGDVNSYQTIYAMVRGSVAAPTAGLHFTRKVFDSLSEKDVERAEITLHVGAGTFLPVKEGDIKRHRMHTEYFFLTRSTLVQIIRNLGNIIAVGTTSVRTLESLYWLGIKLRRNHASGNYLSTGDLFVDQWEPYEREYDTSSLESLETLLSLMERDRINMLKVATRIIIVPGYRFKMIEGMVTNFHQPGSTLLLLVSAWTNGNWKRIYDFALNNNFRFLSYGDSSLLLK